MKRLGIVFFVTLFVLSFGLGHFDSSTANASTTISTYNIGTADTDGDSTMESIVLREEIDYSFGQLDLYVVIDGYEYKVFSEIGREFYVFCKKISDTDGRTGKEVVIGVAYRNVNFMHQFIVVCDRSKVKREYQAGNFDNTYRTSYWSFVGIQNMDGAAGNEIVYNDDLGDSYAIKDSNRTIYQI